MHTRDGAPAVTTTQQPHIRSQIQPQQGVRCRICAGHNLAPVALIDGYRYVECRDCGLTFIPEFTREAARRFYAQELAGTPKRGWAFDLDFLTPAWSWLGRSQGLRLLDFGCGNSTLPEKLRARGNRVIAVDICPPRRPHPDRLTGDLPGLALAAAQFDLVYAYQVVEHLPEPRPYLDELMRLTKPGGLVVIHTNMEPPAREDPLSNWYYACPPHHCSLFRHRTFEILLRDRPHRLVRRDPWCVLLQKAPETAVTR